MVDALFDQWNRLCDRWDRQHPAIKLLTWPLLIPLSLIVLVVAIPWSLWCFAIRESQPPTIELMSRAQLADWANRFLQRISSMLAVNPPECHDVILPLRSMSTRIQSCLLDSDATISEINVVANETLDELVTWKGLPVAELRFLAMHIQKWCEHQDGDEPSNELDSQNPEL